ncbi:hypothetical protein [Paenibacillus sp. GCM10027626]|uniref:hypothetical protein n=1 Tax=Paenibacillus sp. GCM10027626 TaxID=3273411 RepID=UPI0036344943
MFKQRFHELLQQDNNEGIIDLLHDYRSSHPLTAAETGWVYWNLSDSYAMMREVEALWSNHEEFVIWGKAALDPQHLHWFASDATQALTLSLGNHFDTWSDWYLYACEHSSAEAENRGLRFESHRAAAASSLMLQRLPLLDIALNNIRQLLAEDPSWGNAKFAEMEFYSLMLERHRLHNDETAIDAMTQKIELLLEDPATYQAFAGKCEPAEDLLGSLKHFEQSRATSQSFLISLNNLGCSLNKVGRYRASAKLFQRSLGRGAILNDYCGAKYLSSMWRVNGDGQAVIGAMQQLEKSSGRAFKREVLREHAPELINLL